MAGLDTDVRFIKGVGEKKAQALSKLDILTLRDLVRYFPRAYEDRSTFTPIALTLPERPACIRAMVAAQPILTRVRKGMDLVKLRAVDESGSVDITYFNQSYVRDQLKAGETYAFYGKIQLNGSRRTMANPVFEREEQIGGVTGCIVPLYRLTSGISNKIMMSAVRQGLSVCGDILPDPLPDAVREAYALAQARFAYENIHFPADFGALDIARRRFIFEELFVLAAALGSMRRTNDLRDGIELKAFDFGEFYAALPFAPTNAQKRATEEAASDMRSGKQMNRLLQGDVGSGKTLAAAALIWLAWKNGRQSALMAPTEILAEQHLTTLTGLLSPFGIRADKLTGSMTAKRKREAREALVSGQTDLAIGTHALITEDVQFRDLALVVTDEQHRFGVTQRGALSGKAEKPHVLVMSATPIPRTLALIIYGDLDISVIDELPPGRQAVETFAVGENFRPRINAFIRKLVSEGRQVFVVCPMIEENDELPDGIKSAEEHAAHLKAEFPDLRVACIHGRLKPKDKDRVMADFASGNSDILVSTTVVEVGVDVPNAALMIVENAERFGLSQLHQLRGRVGRGEHKSYCVLFSESEGEEAKARLKVMRDTTDGFKISEEDLRLRGPGDCFGSRQHGLPEMHIADLCSDMSVLRTAQAAAKELLEGDPKLEAPGNAALKEHISLLFEASGGALN